MSSYNILKAEIECPRCKQTAKQEIELRFGYTTEMFEFKIGDSYNWRGGKAVQNGGRPNNGDFNGEGYVECSLCKCDFFVQVKIRNDLIEKIEHDSTRQPYIN